MGLYLRVAWICLLCNTGNCYPVDYRDDNTTSFSSPGALEFSDLEYLDVSPPGNESSLEASSAEAPPTLEPEDPNFTSEFNSTSSPVPAPRASHSGPSRNTEDNIPAVSMQSKLVSGAGGFGVPPPSPWYGPQFYHEGMYAGAGAHPYSYESSTVGFPHHSYTGSPYSTALSPYNYGSFHHGYVAPGYPPFGHGTTRTTPPYAYLPPQPPIIDPELLLIGNILMRIRQMPLAQAWRTSEEPVGVTEKYPFSHVVQSNSNYHRARDLRSNSQYSENPSDHSPEPEVLLKPSNVPAGLV